MKETTVPANTEKNAPDTREDTRVLTPPVDIFETENGLVVVADLPGVEKDAIDVNVEKNVLTLKAKAKAQLTENLARQEYQLLPFFRQFQLSDAVDQSKISAESFTAQYSRSLSSEDEYLIILAFFIYFPLFNTHISCRYNP